MIRRGSRLPLCCQLFFDLFSSFLGRETLNSSYGTERRSTVDLLDAALNSKPVKVIDTFKNDDGTTQSVLNVKETEAAQDKQRKIRQAFDSWIYKDPVRQADLVQTYNEKFNSIRNREFDGRHLNTPGLSSAYTLRDHQKRIVWRILQTGKAYMAHGVGAGKTLASIVAGMELKRLGLAKKNMYVVPNHMLRQFSKEFLEAYPNANILVADEMQFEKSKRRAFLSKAATQDWDAIIITQSSFGMIPVSAKFEEKMIQDEIKTYKDALEFAKGDRLTTKKLEKAVEKKEQDLDKLKERKSDNFISFEELGVDQLFADEAQLYRKLSYATSQGAIKGIDPNGSQTAWDMYVKTKQIAEKTGGRGYVPMSGTPVTNTMGELFTIQRFLQEDVLREKGIHHFDAWASMFGDTVTQLEMSPSGDYKPVTRFARFQNIPELTQMFRDVADIVSGEQLGQVVDRPELKGGKMRIVAAPRTSDLEDYQSELAERLEAIEMRNRPLKKGDDIVPVVINDGRLAAIDIRLVKPEMSGNPNSKLNLLIQDTFDAWQQTKDMTFTDKEGKPHPIKGATQMIFSDMGTPQYGIDKGFSAYTWIKQELVRMGVPEKEIAFMQDYKKPNQKLKLFTEMNNGEKRLLIGSSVTMGTGVNAQRRLIKLSHLDAPWIPADVEQRNGRIVRQGNQNKTVEVAAYVTKGSTDATIWQLLETKQKMIDQAMSGDKSIRVMSDMDCSADQFAMAKAISSGNPEILKIAGLEQDIARLERLERASKEEQIHSKINLKHQQEKLEKAQNKLSNIDAALSHRVETKGDEFKIDVLDKTFDKRKDGGLALLQAAMTADPKEIVHVGTISGFKLETAHDGYARDITMSSGKLEILNLSIDKDTSPLGLLRSVEHAISHLEVEKSDVLKTIEQAKRSVDHYSSFNSNIVGFEYANELNEKRSELATIKRGLEEKAIEKEKEKQEKQENEKNKTQENKSDKATLSNPNPEQSGIASVRERIESRLQAKVEANNKAKDIDPAKDASKDVKIVGFKERIGIAKKLLQSK